MYSKQEEQNHPISDDAIPRNAVSLTSAFWIVQRSFKEEPELIPDIDDFWSSALQKSVEPVKQDVDGYLAIESANRHMLPGRTANLLLRSEMQSGRLVACIRELRSGEILQLRNEFWLNPDWEDHIPCVIPTDFIHGDYESPGPQGSLIDGFLRPVFFIRDEFDVWLMETFSHAHEVRISPPYLRPSSKGRTVEAVKEAIIALWRGRPPAGVTADMRQDRINDWLQKNGRVGASKQTIRRALAQLHERP